MSLDGFDNNINPLASDCRGAIADYAPEYNGYELFGHEYVVCDGRVFYPETDVNTDIPQARRHLLPRNPHNYNLEKHMGRLALYELTELIAPNNVSFVRLHAYEDSKPCIFLYARAYMAKKQNMSVFGILKPGKMN